MDRTKRKAIGLTFATFLTFSSFPVFSEENSVHELTEQWIALEMQKGEMLNDFHRRKDAMELQLQLLTLEEETLTEVVNKLNTNTDEVEQERLDLIEKQNTLEKEQKHLREHLKKASAKLAGYTSLLPPPLQSAWKENLVFIDDENKSDSERLERVLTTLNTFNEFNQRIAIHQTALAVPSKDGEKNSAMVKQVYLGASMAWYVSGDGTYYGYGLPYEGSWKWWHKAEAKTMLGKNLDPQNILAVIDIIENPATAKLSALPIALSKIGGEK